jgi:hypothetical protein
MISLMFFELPPLTKTLRTEVYAVVRTLADRIRTFYVDAVSEITGTDITFE